MSTVVVVVGAGASGLAAASKLLKSNMVKEVTVLEARSRTGGRINSENGLDMGAQFVHGEKGNVVFKIAQELNLIDLDEKEQEEIFFVEGGGDENPVDSTEAYELVEMAEEAEDDHVVTEQGESLGHYYESFIAKLIANKSEEFKGKMEKFVDIHHRSLQSDDGCDNWNEDSFIGSAIQYLELEGNMETTYKANKTYSDFLKYFINDIPQEKIRFNSLVTKIELAEEGSKVDVHIGQEVLRADYVIFTGSLGYLKSHVSELFSPSLLSATKLDAIKRQGFGTVDKIYLKFEQIWWPVGDNNDGFAFLFANSTDYSSDSKAKWTRWLYGLNRVRHHENLLVAWLGGEGARRMEALSDKQIQEDLVEVMETFLRAAYPNMTKPVEIKSSRWYSDPLALGSYSHVSVDAAKNIGVAETLSHLATPEGGGRLLFAGEHTHQRFFSTVHGAVETGWREADRIMEKIKLESEKD